MFCLETILLYNDTRNIEKPTRFFFQLERERSSCSSISSILNSDDVGVFTRPEIEQAHVSFYSRIFKEDFIDEACKESCLNGT